MRKSPDEITSEVFGQGSRFIGWKNWLQYQPIFKFIWNKVQESQVIMNRRDFFVKLTKEGHHSADTMIVVRVDKVHGDLLGIAFGDYQGASWINVRANSSTYWADTKSREEDPGKELGDLFENPFKPTFDELDMFEVVYGDEQVLIEINRAFYPTILKYNKAVQNGNVSIFFGE